jgi:hypothetical protein
MPRGVLDTNAFLRAHWSSLRYGRLLSDFAEDYVLAVSPAIIREVPEVLHRQPCLPESFSIRVCFHYW